MTNEKQQKEEKDEVQKTTAGDTGEGSKSETALETERIRSETEALEKAYAERENAKARLNLGGGTYGNQNQKPKEETALEYQKRVMAGTGEYGEE